MTSSTYPIPATLATDPSAASNILSSNISITSDMVSPGGGGILRLYFSFILADPATITVFNNGTAKGTLNAGSTILIISDGYYRFDIDIEAGDNINLQATENITSTNSFFRAHLVQFGA